MRNNLAINSLAPRNAVLQHHNFKTAFVERMDKAKKNHDIGGDNKFACPVDNVATITVGHDRELLRIIIMSVSRWTVGATEGEGKGKLKVIFLLFCWRKFYP